MLISYNPLRMAGRVTDPVADVLRAWEALCLAAVQDNTFSSNTK
jgi:hypothetical protein